MPMLEFCTRSARDADNRQATGERLINLYPEPLPEGGRAQFALKAVPGLASIVNLGSVFVRAMANVPRYVDGKSAPSDRLMMLNGGSLKEIAPDGSVQTRSTIPDDPQSTISGNNGDVTVVASGRYFVRRNNLLLEPSPGAFSEFGAVEFLGDYTILTERGGRRFQWSDLADATTLPGLNFATAETRDDAILRPIAIAGNLWLFKQSCIEVWQRTGLSGENAFSLIAGAVLETGLKAHGLICKIPNGAFLVGDDGIAYVTGGAQLQPVSTPAVEDALRSGEPTNCMYYEDRGHKFCVIRFDNRPAWVFDIATGMWHERASGTDGAWAAQAMAYCYGEWHVAALDGLLYRTANNLKDDTTGSGYLSRRAVSRPLFMQGPRFRVPLIELYGTTGTTTAVEAPQFMVRFSRDGGMTWGTERKVNAGKQGVHGARMPLRSVGQARVLVAEVTMTDSTDVTLWSSARVELA